jgi:hypothetical protein
LNEGKEKNMKRCRRRRRRRKEGEEEKEEAECPNRKKDFFQVRHPSCVFYYQ